MQFDGAVSGLSQCARGSLPQSLRAVLERADVVVRKEIRKVLAALGQLLDPLRGAPVLLRPLRARNLAVGDVADEDVAERELVLSADG